MSNPKNIVNVVPNHPSSQSVPTTPASAGRPNPPNVDVNINVDGGKLSDHQTPKQGNDKRGKIDVYK